MNFGGYKKNEHTIFYHKDSIKYTQNLNPLG